jgi:hypothetical protein
VIDVPGYLGKVWLGLRKLWGWAPENRVSLYRDVSLAAELRRRKAYSREVGRALLARQVERLAAEHAVELEPQSWVDPLTRADAEVKRRLAAMPYAPEVTEADRIQSALAWGLAARKKERAQGS